MGGDWTLWLEVDSICNWFLAAPAPTGIERCAVNLFATWSNTGAGSASRVRLCRFDPDAGRFREISRGLFAELVGSEEIARGSTEGVRYKLPLRGKLRGRLKLAYYRILHWLFGVLEHKVGKWRDYLWPEGAERLKQELAQLPEASVSKSDVVLFVGLNLGSHHYFEALRREKRSIGFYLAWIVHDLLPFVRPEFVVPEAPEEFVLFVSRMCTNADLALCISRSTLRDLTRFTSATGTPHPRSEVITLGCQFAERSRRQAGATLRNSSVKQPYVLFTSRIDPRKNHTAVLTVWQRLIERHGFETVPNLVLVGPVGWMAEGTMELLRTTNYLGGKVVHRADASDDELAALYRNCLCTLFPSHFEGFGLPVAESLAFGKLCIASNTSSIPEVGGNLVDYINPSDLHALYAAVERAIFDDDYRKRREANIAEEHHPLRWRDSTADVMARITEFRRGRIAADTLNVRLEPTAD